MYAYMYAYKYTHPPLHPSPQRRASHVARVGVWCFLLKATENKLLYDSSINPKEKKTVMIQPIRFEWFDSVDAIDSIPSKYSSFDLFSWVILSDLCNWSSEWIQFDSIVTVDSVDSISSIDSTDWLIRLICKPC